MMDLDRERPDRAKVLPSTIPGHRWVETGYDYWMLESDYRRFHGGVGQCGNYRAAPGVEAWAWHAKYPEQGESASRGAAMAAVERSLTEGR